MSEIVSIDCVTWQDFKVQILTELFGDRVFKRGAFLFRGQGDADWSLTSSYDRWFECRGLDEKYRVDYASELLKNFQEEIQTAGVDEIVREDEVLSLALGQHYGLPTRLLDWTESPYVAAFFAFVGLLDLEKEGDVAVWALDKESFVWSKERGVELLSVPAHSNVRLRNQEGKFSICRGPFRSLEDYVANFSKMLKTPVLFKFVIPASEGSHALADLDAMGINPLRCYPDLTGAAAAARLRHWLFNLD
jgi:hypothetical protein